jgi:hypothetical protein
MEDSIETHFILFIHKTLLSFSYLERNQQRFILRDLQQFIHRLTQLFQNSTLHQEERRLKIIEILVKYLQKLHKDQISHLISHENKEELLKQIEKDAYSYTMKHTKRVHFEDEKKVENHSISIQEKEEENKNISIHSENIEEEEVEEEVELSSETMEKFNIELRKMEEKMIQKVIEMKRLMSHMDVEMDRKMEIRIKSNFIEIESFNISDLSKK